MKTLYITLVLIFTFSFAQDSAGGQTPTATSGKIKPAEAPKKKSMEEALKDKKEISGLFTLYQDTTNGKLSMLVNNDQIGKEFYSFCSWLKWSIKYWCFQGKLSWRPSAKTEPIF
jgi:hypothetical protein